MSIKCGEITNHDCLFNDLSTEIYDKYTEIGMELGLNYEYLQNELETGDFRMKQGSKKAMKMLQLWKQSATKENFTYAVLADALEKRGFHKVANEYCYM